MSYDNTSESQVKMTKEELMQLMEDDNIHTLLPNDPDRFAYRKKTNKTNYERVEGTPQPKPQGGLKLGSYKFKSKNK